MSKPVLLDLFCKAGGASVGYHKAGFEVVGVDIEPQPNYPFTFIQSDALKFLREKDLSKYSAIAASPPCQRFSTITGKHRYKHKDLITPTRPLLVRTGLPYVIENVPGTPLIDPVKLCGEMFGLRVVRHRWFEVNWALDQPDHKKHRGKTVGAQRRSRGSTMLYAGDPEAYYFAVYGQTLGPYKGSLQDWRSAMGIDWMEAHELAQAIPPAYTEWIGRKLLHTLGYRRFKKPKQWL